MWHLKTKQGTFWVIESPDTKKYLLGVNNDELGTYESADSAAQDVKDQVTGFLQWDCQSRVRIPTDLESWSQGEPSDW